MPEFVEKYNGSSRKRLFKKVDLNIFDIPTGPHLQKSESLDRLDLADLHEQRLSADNFILTEYEEKLQLEKSPHRFVRTE